MDGTALVWITKQEAMRRTGFSDSAIDRRERNGDFIQRVNTGRRIKYFEHELEEWMLRQQRGTVPEPPQLKAAKPRRARL